MTSHALIQECLEGEDQLKGHFRVVKLIGVVFIALFCALPGIVMISVSVTHRRPVDYEIQPIDLNHTACLYVKQYHLQGNVYGTLCNQNGLIFLDIRRFLNGTATPIGIQLELHQWLTLKQLTPLIDEAISEARNYWRTLKTYKRESDIDIHQQDEQPLSVPVQ